MKKKRLLFVYYKLFKPGGIARVLVNLVNELIEDYDITILVLMSKHDSFYTLDNRVNVIYIDSFSHWAFTKINVNIDKYFKWLPKRNELKNYFYDFGAYQTSISWLKENHTKFDHIITCQYKLSAGVSLHKEIAEKTIAWEHNPHTSGGFIWGRIREKNYKNLKFVVATNKDGERYFKSHMANSKVVYNIMNPVLLEYNHIPTDQKENIISLIVRLVPEKNVLEFIEIIGGLNLPKNWKIQILGDGPLFNLIEDSIISKNLTEKIILLGGGTIEEVYDLMKISKILCLTSTNEALPTVLIEGMFFSNVLISYDCNFGPSDIINDKNGFLIPLHNKIQFIEKLQFLIDNPSRLAELNKSSFEESQNWRKDERLKEWKEILS